MRQALLAIALAAQVPIQAQDRSTLIDILNFEAQHTGDWPAGWGGGPPGTVYVDGKVVHGGKWSARLERKADSPSNFSTITKSIPIDFAASKVELRGFLRTEQVSEFVGLWLREDGESPGLAFDNMQNRQIKGTTDWTEYSIVLPVHKVRASSFSAFCRAEPERRGQTIFNCW